MKRIFDIICSLFGLLILMPVLVVISLWVAFSSKGGVFYLQKRVGIYGNDFSLFKFRTMQTGSDKKGLLTVGMNDSRITQIGIILRKYKLDELPQLINVLIGDMSLVGPRPEVRKYVLMYNNEQKKVLSVRPGITDFASIEYFDENRILGESENPEETYIQVIMPHKLKLNLKYVASQSVLTDLKIIVKTLKKIVK